MPALDLSPALSVLAAFSRITSPQPVHTFFRSAGYKLQPPRPLPCIPAVSQAQDRLLANGGAERRQLSKLLCEQHHGPLPSIVLGGFVPDSTEQVFLLRGFLLRRGSVYYFNYPRCGFSLDLFCAQLDDLVSELNELHGLRPVIFGVSFGAGLLLEWLRRARAAGRRPQLAGALIVSPVACVADVLDPNEVKPSTLLGRALKPMVEAGPRVDSRGIEKARTIFAKMFEAGAQNKTSLRAVLTREELHFLRDRVLGSIQDLDPQGAVERVQALHAMPPLSAWTAAPGHLPLSESPALVLFAEKESAVLADGSPTRLAFEAALPAFFPRGWLRVVKGDSGNAVQHASLIFHYFQFLPHITEFYRGLKSGKFRQAA